MWTSCKHSVSGLFRRGKIVGTTVVSALHLQRGTAFLRLRPKPTTLRTEKKMRLPMSPLAVALLMPLTAFAQALPDPGAAPPAAAPPVVVDPAAAPPAAAPVVVVPAPVVAP